jgi:glutathione synthase/RimK-type ligase-like ATP-grasp enzyme
MFVCYHPRTRPTGKAIAHALGLPFGIRPKRSRSLIRWGSTYGWLHDERRRQVINKGTAVATAANKHAAFLVLERAGVLVPFFTADKEEAESWLDDVEGRILLGRTLNGWGGRHITVYEPSTWVFTEVGQHPLYTGYVPNKREYRIHVVGGEIVRTQRKYLERPEQQTAPIIKNHEQGYVFNTPRDPLPDAHNEAAISAVLALSLDFGCVDMVVNEDGLPVILEVNSAPACAPMTLNAYVDRLRLMIS